LLAGFARNVASKISVEPHAQPALADHLLVEVDRLERHAQIVHGRQAPRNALRVGQRDLAPRIGPHLGQRAPDQAGRPLAEHTDRIAPGILSGDGAASAWPPAWSSSQAPVAPFASAGRPGVGRARCLACV
jgi:hypothetical protein